MQNKNGISFDDLCKDFNCRRPVGKPVSKKLWFKVRWEDGNESVNDLLRRFLRDHGYEYLNTFNGDIWFLYQGDWRCCDYKVSENIVCFYMCDFNDTIENSKGVN